MRKYLFLVFIVAVSTCSFAQTEPQKDFTEKVSLNEQKAAEAFLKGPFVYNGNNYDLKYHRMLWHIDPDTLYIYGEVTSYFTAVKPSVSQLRFDFSSAMTVDSVCCHSIAVPYSHSSGDTLIINLPSSLSQGQLDSVTVYYHGSPPQGSGFGSFKKGSHDSIPVIWTLSEPFGAKEWWPCKNDLSDKIDSMDIYVVTPSQYCSASNGMLVSETVAGNLKTAHWKHRYPIAAYLIAVAVTNYQSFSVYARNGADSIQILNYVYPENLADAQAHIPEVIPFMELYDSLFITYPFVKERYGHTQFGWGGGMEHQTMTFLYNFSSEIMSHELAHQWVGDMITCGNWHEIWLNEGFATYWTGLTYNYLQNGLYWQKWKQIQIDKITSQPGGSVYCEDTTSVGRIFDGRLSYSKGAMVLHMLRWIIGDSAFFAGMKSYLSDTSLEFNYACSDDFIFHMESASGKNLIGFFSDWLFGEGYPIYTIHCAVSPGSNDVQITIDQSQSHSSVSFFEMPVPLKFKDSTHDTIIVLDHTYSGQQFTVNAGFRPDSIVLDPDRWIVHARDTVLMNIEEFNSSDELQIYPNPSGDIITVTIPGRYPDAAEIYDTRGQLMQSLYIDIGPKSSFHMDISDLAEGIYILKVACGDEALIKKIVKL
jgi:aminopeptidase N